jgi:multicomponent Na+:H+ antiporter subunit D
MVAFFIGSLSIIGLPPTGGTWSKWYLLMATLETEQLIIMAILMLSSLLNIAYLMPIPFHAFFSNIPAKIEHGESAAKVQIKEAPMASLIAIGIAALGCLVLFIYPNPLHELASAILEPQQLTHGN